MKTRFASVLLAQMTLLCGACSDVNEPPPNPGSAELFELCAQCHGEKAAGNRAVNAPSIAGLPQWYIEAQLKKFKSGGRGTHFDDLSGMQMRPMAMSLATDDQITTVAKYVASLPVAPPAPLLTGGDAAKGKALYTPCMTCHGPEAAGLEAMKAPPLNHASDWYLYASLQKFKAGIRGSNPADSSGAMMRPMASTLPDEQAMKDVTAYIVTLKK